MAGQPRGPDQQDRGRIFVTQFQLTGNGRIAIILF
jgi:hypothetical protein